MLVQLLTSGREAGSEGADSLEVVDVESLAGLSHVPATDERDLGEEKRSRKTRRERAKGRGELEGRRVAVRIKRRLQLEALESLPSTPLVLSPKTMSKINQPGTQIKYVCFWLVDLLERILQGPSSGHFKADLSGPRHAPFLLCLPG